MSAKFESLQEEKLGNMEYMIYVNILCVKPDKQGLGYGSALLNAIIFMVRHRGEPFHIS